MFSDSFLRENVDELRDIGFVPWFQKTFTSNSDIDAWIAPQSEQEFFVDNNMISLGKLTSVFPEPIAYLGGEVPKWALVKPIPRAIWKNKPEGLSTGIEDAMGISGHTVAVLYRRSLYGFRPCRSCWIQFVFRNYDGALEPLVRGSPFSLRPSPVCVGICLCPHYHEESFLVYHTPPSHSLFRRGHSTP